MTRPARRVKPSTVYEAALWTAVALFYASLITLVLVIFNHAGAEYVMGMLAAVFGTAIGVMQMREIHMANLLDTRDRPAVSANDGDGW